MQNKLPEWLEQSIDDRYNIDGLLKSAQLKKWIRCLIAGAENWEEDQYLNSRDHPDWFGDDPDSEQTYKAVASTLSYAKQNEGTGYTAGAIENDGSDNT